MTRNQAQALAPRMVEAGWPVDAIRREFARRGVRVGWYTVCDWCGGSRQAVDRMAPLPLGHSMAVRQALELRRRPHMTWTAIAEVMRVYHGLERGPEWWSKHVRAAGAESCPRGNAFGVGVRG